MAYNAHKIFSLILNYVFPYYLFLFPIFSLKHSYKRYAYQYLLIEEFNKFGTEVIFLNHQMEHNPEADLLLQMQGIISEYERTKIMERSRRGKLHAARHGEIGVLSGAPYGYKYVSKQLTGRNAVYEIVEEEAEVVRQLFKWVGLERLSLAVFFISFHVEIFMFFNRKTSKYREYSCGFAQSEHENFS